MHKKVWIFAGWVIVFFSIPKIVSLIFGFTINQAIILYVAFIVATLLFVIIYSAIYSVIEDANRGHGSQQRHSSYTDHNDYGGEDD